MSAQPSSYAFWPTPWHTSARSVSAAPSPIVSLGRIDAAWEFYQHFLNLRARVLSGIVGREPSRTTAPVAAEATVCGPPRLADLDAARFQLRESREHEQMVTLNLLIYYRRRPIRVQVELLLDGCQWHVIREHFETSERSTLA